jgi:hypothetical protein
MEPLIGLLAVVVALLCAFTAVRARRPRSRTSDVVMRIDIGKDPNVPLAVVNAGRDPVFDVEATLRFEPRAPRTGHVMERHRRALVLLPGERLAFPLPENIAGAKAAEHATLVRCVRLDAVARDSTGRSVGAHDVLEDPLTWIESERRSRSAVHTIPPRKDDR